jgi:hypothetical protein
VSQTQPAPQLLLSPEVEDMQRRWHAFADHARLCRPACHAAAAACCRPGRQTAELDPLYEDCCEVGKPLFADWRLAVAALRAAYIRS